MKRNRVLFDIGSTYFKAYENGTVEHFFRDFTRPIFDDLNNKCRDILSRHEPEDIYFCSSANGGLSTLIIGLSNSYSLRYAVNIAFNSGINIIDTILYPDIENAIRPTEPIDVVIIVGGIDGIGTLFDERLTDYLNEIEFQNIVYAGNCDNRDFVSSRIGQIVVLENIIDEDLKIREHELKKYLTDLYQADIIGKEDIKQLYELSSNQIFSTPYIVNRSLQHINRRLNIADPFIVIDIGGATTDIHYSRDLVADNIVAEGGYDRLVFKKLGVYKSRESLVHIARQNEFVYEMLGFLGATEDILESKGDEATRILMQLAIFLVLYKVSHHHADYVELELEKLNTIVLTGGISKVLSDRETEEIISFFYKKLLRFHTHPKIVTDRNYEIWTYGMLQDE